jgi:hypothetical protein
MPAIKSAQILLNNCRSGSLPTINTVKLDRKRPSNLTGYQVTELIYHKKNRPKQSGNKRKNLDNKPDPKSI